MTNYDTNETGDGPIRPPTSDDLTDTVSTQQSVQPIPEEDDQTDPLPPFDELPEHFWREPEWVVAMRGKMWRRGWRPLPIWNHDAREPWVKSPGKQPAHDDWQLHARTDPPPCAVTTHPDERTLNTGILCGRVLAFDLDVDDAELVASLRSLVESKLGTTPSVRYRDNSPRILMLYAAAEGEPRKRKVGVSGRQIEVLGNGQQFVAYGFHPTGALLRWESGQGPGWIAFSALPK